MRLLVTLFAFALAIPAFAGETPPLGNFEGLAFSSATSRHAVTIHGGDLVNCENSATEWAKCEVQGGTLKVSGPAENALSVTFSLVNVYHSAIEPSSWHYYYRGSADLMIGSKSKTIPVSATLNIEDDEPDRLFGVIELPDEYTKTTIEAYRVSR